MNPLQLQHLSVCLLSIFTSFLLSVCLPAYLSVCLTVCYLGFELERNTKPSTQTMAFGHLGTQNHKQMHRRLLHTYIHTYIYIYRHRYRYRWYTYATYMCINAHLHAYLWRAATIQEQAQTSISFEPQAYLQIRAPESIHYTSDTECYILFPKP